MLRETKMWAVVLLTVIGAACSGKSPTDPGTIASAGAPGGKKPSASVPVGVQFVEDLASYTRQATDPDRDNPLQGDIESPLMTLQGTVSGSPGSRIIKASGPGTITIIDVVPDQVPFDINCLPDGKEATLLRPKNLVGSSISGTFSSFTVDEAERLVHWGLENILPTGSVDGVKWHAWGGSTSNFRAIIDVAGTEMTITQNYGELGIGSDGTKRTAEGASCRGYWTIKVTLPS